MNTATSNRHRIARHDDLAAIQGIERDAGHLFRAVGMDAIAEDEPVGSTVFQRFREDGGAWVAVDDGESVIAYMLVEPLDTALHVEQVTVHPNVARRGLGAELLALAGEQATGSGLSALTLTTFRDVPWNAPYYARLGFDVFLPDKWGPGLRRRVAKEAASGLDAWPRVAMRRRLVAGSTNFVTK